MCALAHPIRLGRSGSRVHGPKGGGGTDDTCDVIQAKVNAVFNFHFVQVKTKIPVASRVGLEHAHHRKI